MVNVGKYTSPMDPLGITPLDQDPYQTQLCQTRLGVEDVFSSGGTLDKKNRHL